MREALARAWSEPDYGSRIAAALAGLLDDADAALFDWQDPGGDVVRLLGTTNSGWAENPSASHDSLRQHLLCDPHGGDRMANRVVDDAWLRRDAPQRYVAFEQAALRPLGLGPYAQVALHDQHRFLAHCSLMRPSGSAPFHAQELDQFQQLVPDLCAGLTARLALDHAGLARGAVTEIADAMAEPAFIAAPGGVVVFANRLARSAYPRPPSWLARCTCDEDPSRRPRWIGRVVLQFDACRLFLLIPRLLDVDLDSAPAAPWAEHSGLPPRLARVAACMLQGLADKDIAARLGLSHATVRTYARRILSLAEVHNRTELVRAALRAGSRDAC